MWSGGWLGPCQSQMWIRFEIRRSCKVQYQSGKTRQSKCEGTDFKEEETVARLANWKYEVVMHVAISLKQLAHLIRSR